MSRHLRPVASVEQLVDRETLAEILDVHVNTVDAMRKAGMPWIPWGRRLVRFEPSKCVAWLKEHGHEEAAA